jgi:hypothetical protein
MKLIFKVTGVSKITDDKQLVQLQGKFGHVSLNLPLTARVTVGDEFVLGRHQETALGHVGDIDETRNAFSPMVAPGISPPPKASTAFDRIGKKSPFDPSDT